MKRNYLGILASIVIISVSLFPFTDAKSENIANWTIMYYMCSDVKNTDIVWTYPLIENLTKIRSSPDLNIVVLNDGFQRGDLQLFYIDISGEKIDLTQKFGWPSEVDTSNLNTLELFTKQMMQAYPAKHYCLIPIVSGGSGWQLFCLHDSHDGKVGVSIPNFAATLKNIVQSSHHKIDILFTSCAMNMVEIAYEFSPYVDYIVGSQTCFSREHLVQRFCESIEDLKNNTSMSAEEFAKRTPERLVPLSFYYDESYYGKLPLLNRILNKLPFSKLHTVRYNESSAVINLSAVPELLMLVKTLKSLENV